MNQISVNWIASMAAEPGSKSGLLSALKERLERHLQMVEDHLSRATYFAGTEFTAADIIMHFPFGTMKAFYDVGLDNRPNILAWLARISDRPTYQRAMKAAGYERDPALNWGATRGAF
jgi:glutathione S-transferase